ncbi:phospho-N-acetylmuramoyl-pentapeptide-transferase [Candidatus Cytomitobacter indipagum]|uniref:Phospho-N-acetylmuramoyl-pentapeptide-transferase n=1 Tax=Candidatus Cytomitobacter indipagum TaxID=2601575 RepID=A0A5C0UF09_9PROT|nr:phospho-N-acetylmuramoyl-pentapeptide-transferase [Candidatus Cytomitobacter indipagum]QEK37852.1 phospho-N-acetylmuramoyl-pentapeptide-transferase [Candidatus Cytomitobacter indipagum]
MAFKLQLLTNYLGMAFINQTRKTKLYLSMLIGLIALNSSSYFMNTDFMNTELKLITNITNVLIFTCYSVFFFTSAYIKIIRGKFSQPISKYIKHNHKKNTPTMGGMIFLTSFILSSLYLSKFLHLNANHYLIIILTTLFGFIGLLDDALKIIRKNNKGIKASHKFILQILTSLLTLYAFKQNLDISYLSIIWWTFVINGTANAVNLTDGLDGLAASCSLITITSFSIMHFIKFGPSTDLMINAIIFVAIFSFLQFNRNPARIFMGDVGSMSLGAFIAINYLLIGQEWILTLAGIVFVLEAMSVIVQMISIKLFKRKIFITTPIHHHFEHYMKEKNITKLFVCFAILVNALIILFII